MISIVFIVDATGSMSSTLSALKPALTQLCKLLPLFADIKMHLITYRDFDQSGDMLYKHHGPFEMSDIDKMNIIISNTTATGGDDAPECMKYAFNRMINDINADNLVVFHFTDAPPHSLPYPTSQTSNNNHYKEGYTLKINNMTRDWIELCDKFRIKNIPVYTIGKLSTDCYPFYTIMSEMTGGDVILLDNNDMLTILKCTVNVCARALGYNDCDLIGLGKIQKICDSDISNLPKTENQEFYKLNTYTVKPDQTILVRNKFDVCNRTRLETRYQNDEKFRELCFKTFLDILNSDQILSITYNPLTGVLYRLMNKRQRNATNSVVNNLQLSNLMSLQMSKLKNINQSHYDIMAKWMEESYNCIEKINEIIMSLEGPLVPFLVLQIEERISKKDMANACKIPMPHHLKLLSAFIAGINVIEKQPNIMPEVFVPLNISDKELFRILSHLMCPGTIMDLKLSIVLALVSLNQNNIILAERAHAYLKESIGRWFDKNDTEWHLFGFIKMILSLHKKYNDILTNDEVKYLEPLFLLGSIKQNNPEFDIKLPLKLSHGILYSDHKVKCNICSQFRSTSVMTPIGCGLCLSYKEDRLKLLNDMDSQKSYLFDCTVCGSRYAVRDTDNLHAKPKCHYHRNLNDTTANIPSIEVPKINCSVCDINIILPISAQFISTDKIFMCAICVDNAGVAKYDTSKVRMHDILKENQWLIEKITKMKIDIDYIVDRSTLFSIRDKYQIIDDPDSLVSYPKIISYNNQKIINSAEIIEQITDRIKNGFIANETCMICFDTLIHHDIEPICYNKGCKASACKKCIIKWFQINTPGTRVFENRTKCPCCKKNPVKGLAFTNMYLRSFYAQKVNMDPDWHYVWCKGCYKVKEYMERRCAGPEPMDISDNYVCEDCMNPTGKYKKCPFCAMPTAKMSGCDHMECPAELGGCGLHWCYRCEEPNIFNSKQSQDVYNHMYDVHGNIWGAYDLNNDNNEEE